MRERFVSQSYKPMHRVGLKVGFNHLLASPEYPGPRPWHKCWLASVLRRLHVMSQKPRRKSPSPQGKRGSELYEALDADWRKIGLPAPARRALVDAKLYKVSDLRNVTLDELIAMQGMGKSAVARIRTIMDAKGIRFR